MQRSVSKKCSVNNNSCELLEGRSTSLFVSQRKQETKLKGSGLRFQALGKGQTTFNASAQ